MATRQIVSYLLHYVLMKVWTAYSNCAIPLWLMITMHRLHQLLWYGEKFVQIIPALSYMTQMKVILVLKDLLQQHVLFMPHYLKKIRPNAPIIFPYLPMKHKLLKPLLRNWYMIVFIFGTAL